MATKIRPVEVSFKRDLNGTYLFIKSALIEDEAKRYSSGDDDPDTYYIPRVNSDRTFIFNVPAESLGGDELWRALRTKGLANGITIKMNRPISKDLAKQITAMVGEMVKTHVSNHLAAYRVSMVVEMEESIVRWRMGTSAETEAR